MAFSISILVFFSYTIKRILNILEVFEKEIQQREMVKSLCKSVGVLQIQICLTQSPAIVSNQL